MGIIHQAIFLNYKQLLLLFVKPRLLFKKSIIKSASMRTQVSYNRHAMHKATKYFISTLFKTNRLCNVSFQCCL